MPKLKKLIEWALALAATGLLVLILLEFGEARADATARTVRIYPRLSSGVPDRSLGSGYVIERGVLYPTLSSGVPDRSRPYGAVDSDRRGRHDRGRIDGPSRR